jgi:hypothetical protein
MHIIIAEKNDNGREILNRILKTEGYRVSIAESGSHAFTLLKEARTNIVLINIVHGMYSANSEPKLTIHSIGACNPTLLVTCGTSEEGIEEFISPESLCPDKTLELPPTKPKNSSANRILQMCGALRQSRFRSRQDGNINWPRFSLLMHLPTEAYLGCGFVK